MYFIWFELLKDMELVWRKLVAPFWVSSAFIWWLINYKLSFQFVLKFKTPISKLSQLLKKRIITNSFVWTFDKRNFSYYVSRIKFYFHVAIWMILLIPSPSYIIFTFQIWLLFCQLFMINCEYNFIRLNLNSKLREHIIQWLEKIFICLTRYLWK